MMVGIWLCWMFDVFEKSDVEVCVATGLLL